MSQSFIQLQRATHISNVGATIVTSDDGGPIRTLRTRGMRRPNGRFPSRKALRMLPFDAMHERDLLWISEADPDVVTFLSQPHRLEINVGKSRPLIYFPDLQREMSDRTIEIVETKKTLDEVSRDPMYEMKLDLARQVYEGMGWRFTVMDWATITKQPRYANAKRIVLSRHTRLTTEDLMRLHEALGRGTLSYGEAIAAVSQVKDPYDIVAREKVHACIVDRVLALDITRPLKMSSPVHLGPKAFHA